MAPDTPPPRRVLVVDDNVDAAQSLAVLLHLWGHQVESVHNGPDAIAAATRNPPDVVLLDIGLPEMDGYEVAYRLRHATDPDSAAPLILAMSGYGQDDDRLRAREAGIDQHMLKPLNLSLIAEIIADPAAYRASLARSNPADA